MILPIMVLNVLGVEQAAYYYIAYAIAALLFMIPSAISMSLFVEGSHGEALKRTVVKSLVTIFSLLVPAACVLYVCGGWVLGVVGAELCGWRGYNSWLRRWMVWLWRMMSFGRWGFLVSAGFWVQGRWWLM